MGFHFHNTNKLSNSSSYFSSEGISLNLEQQERKDSHSLKNVNMKDLSKSSRHSLHTKQKELFRLLLCKTSDSRDLSLLNYGFWTACFHNPRPVS